MISSNAFPGLVPQSRGGLDASRIAAGARPSSGAATSLLGRVRNYRIPRDAVRCCARGRARSVTGKPTTSGCTESAFAPYFNIDNRIPDPVYFSDAAPLFDSSHDSCGAVLKCCVRSNSANGQFDLEILEPRILLSAEPSLLAPAVTHSEFADTAAAAVTEEGMPQQANSAITYDCTAQLDGIFEGVANSQPVAEAEAPGPAAGNNEAAPGEPAPAENDAINQAAESPLAPAPASPAPVVDEGSAAGPSSPDNSNPLPAQLTETLRAANGPPCQGRCGGYTSTPFVDPVTGKRMCSDCFFQYNGYWPTGKDVP